MMKWLLALMVSWGALLAGEMSYPASLYDEVIVKNAKVAHENAQKMEEALKNNQGVKESFEALALSWKKVQALNIAGELDEGAVDLPYEIDIYHNAKESVTEQLDRIIASESSAQTGMFKNSVKTITALEYLLYKKSVKADKEREMALIAATSITKKLATFVAIYEKARPEIANNEARFNAMLLNQLGVSSYELKEWRVGEATGLSKKYKDNPDIKKAEFHLSGLSVKAIGAILEAHVQVMENKAVPNFGDKAIEYGASNDVALIRSSIKSAQSAIKEMNNALMNGANKKLYGSLGKLHNGYYVSLISTLRMTSKLLDADGD